MKMINTVQRPFLVVAHRGARTHSDPRRMAPENTLPAFVEAARQNAAIELDVMSIADGRLVIHHDERTGRMFQLPGKQKNVAQLSWPELMTARLNAKGHEATVATMMADEGAYTLPEAFRTVQIPQLEDVLDAVPDTPILVELKPTKHQKKGFEAAVLETIRRKKAQDRVTLISFDSNSLRQVKKLDPTVKTALNFTLPKALTTNIPFLWAYIHLFAKNWVGADGLQPDYDSTTPALVKLSHEAGLPIVPWVNHQTRAQEKATFPRLLALGVDGLITNAVDLLKQAVENQRPQSLRSGGGKE
jgi:glycerophosphoryl diester phosphodiesterase